MFFSKNSRKFATSVLYCTGFLLVVQKNYQPIGVTVHSHCVESFEGLLQRCRRGRSCSELWKNTIFPEHPVHKISLLLSIKITILLHLFGVGPLNNAREKRNIDFEAYEKGWHYDRDHKNKMIQTFISWSDGYGVYG